MDRLACVDVPALPLQLFARAHAELAGEPLAVVERDGANARVLWADARARAAGVERDMRFGAAIALCPRLVAGVVPESEIESASCSITELLRAFAPHVERETDGGSAFWIDARGLERLAPDLRAWAEGIVAALASASLRASVVVGFTRFCSYAIARSLAAGRVLVLDEPASETTLAHGARLDRLGFAERALRDLDALSVRTVRDLVRLPRGSVLARFGHDAERLHALASGQRDERLAPQPAQLPITAHVDLDFPDADRARWLAHVEELAQPLFALLEERGLAAASIRLRATLEDGALVDETLSPAAPTRDLAWLLRLLALRLESTRASSGAERLEIELAPARPRSAQQELFAESSPRDRAALGRALAALRAAFGEDAVVRARLCDAHLPEASFAWERARTLASPAPDLVRACVLVRRVLATPLALPSRPRHEPDGWLLRGVTHGSVARTIGPYVLRGGWWQREVERDYHFAEMKGGEVFWIYHDRARRRWFLHGSVA